MSEYIERETLKEMFSSNNKPLETAICSVIDAVPAADVAEVRHGSASMAKRVKFPLTVTENPLFVNACT